MILTKLVLPLLFAVPTGTPVVTVANEFAAHYNEWGNLPRVEGTINAKEIRAWHETQRAWKNLNSSVHY